MLRSRVIPFLLIKDKGLVKTERFSDHKYVGDPINAVRIFNEKEVDELAIVDIDATVDGREPDYPLIEKLASESRMPLCYGGGIKSLTQAERIISSGIEKVALSSAVIDDPNIVVSLSDKIGRQSVVVVLDVKKTLLGGYDVYTHRGKKKAGVKLPALLKQLNDLGVGEVVVNSIDNDGRMTGYDKKLIRLVRESITCPMTALGGVGKFDDIRDLVQEFKVIGAGAGSYFVFKGPYKAVLISYISYDERQEITRLSKR